MPKPIDNFNMDSVFGGYDPVAELDASVGVTGDLPEGDDFREVKETETEETETEETETEETEAEETETEETETEETETEETETEETDGEDELVPGVPNKISKEQLATKTQDRLRKLAREQKELRQQLEAAQAKLAAASTPREERAAVKEVEKQTSALELNADSVKQMFDKALDNDLDGATAMFSELMQQIAQTAATTARNEATATLTQEQQRQETFQVIDELKGKYEVLDDESDLFDEAMATEIVAMRDLYIQQQGMGIAPALRKAAKMVLMDRGLWEQESEGLLAPDTAAAKAKKAEAAATRNSKEARRKAAIDQPPAPASKPVGEDVRKINVMELTDEEFDALTDAELAKLTGTQYS